MQHTAGQRIFVGRIFQQVVPSILSERLGPHHRSWAVREASSLAEGRLFGMVQADQIGEVLVDPQIA